MKTSLFTIAFCIIPFLALACTCAGPSSFCETINLDSNEGITIIGGRKISETDFTMDILVIKVYQGEESRSRITVFGDSGAACLVYTSQFEIGEDLILALHKNGDWNNADEEDNNYELSSCGLYYISCNNSLNPFTGEYEDISECLGDNICSCSESASTFYPNPNDGMLYSKIEYIDDYLEDFIYVYNISGQIVRTLKISNERFENGVLELDLSDLSAGVYIIQYNFRKDCGKMESTKIVIL